MISNITMNNKPDFSATLLDFFSTHDTKKAFRNITTTIDKYVVNENLIIATVNDEIIEDNCYVVSPYALIISYAKVELHKVKNFLLILPLRALIKIFSIILSFSKIDKVQILNNYMLSTNFYDEFWSTLSIKDLTKIATSRYPQHAVLIRSLNKSQNLEIIKNLEDANWVPVVTRSVYLFKELDLQKRDVVSDLSLLKSKRFIFVKPGCEEDFVAAERLYNELYLKKYTVENVQYTALFMQVLHNKGLLHLKLLKDTDNDEFVAVIGIVGNKKIATTPIVGYKLSRPKEDALYRRCTAYVMNYAHQNNLFFNMSSGVPEFKKNRGAKQEIEYMYLYTKHLSWTRRGLWKLLVWISWYVYKPILIKKGL